MSSITLRRKRMMLRTKDRTAGCVRSATTRPDCALPRCAEVAPGTRSRRAIALGTIVAAAVAVTSGGGHATADLIIITNDTVIGEDDLSLVGHDVVVRGATLTIDGTHHLSSLVLERNEANQPAIVRHSPAFMHSVTGQHGLQLFIDGNLFIQGQADSLVASRIDVSGRGHPNLQGPGAGQFGSTCGGIPAAKGAGAGYGGRGGNGCLPGGATYGSALAPDRFGSGGGNGGTNPGAWGGGAVQITVGGSAVVNGVIRANGGNALNSCCQAGGSGSGGSIWITAAVIAGSGSIEANGGTSPSFDFSSGGGGGGGRIRLDADAYAFGGTVKACGGGPVRAGAGSIVIAENGVRELIYDNCGNQGNTTDAPEPIVADHVLVRGQARLSSRTLEPLEIHATGSLVVEPDGFIDLNGRGYAALQGPGAGQSGPGCGGIPAQKGSGAGYGGAGGPGCLPGGPGYGVMTIPFLPGSGGGNAGWSTGGRGGGFARIVAPEQILVNGMIRANGAAASTGGVEGGGGGSGGSLWLESNKIAGTGFVQARGGGGASLMWGTGGNGGGGRIAMYACENYLPGANVQVFAGAGGNGGGIGTIFNGCHGSITTQIDPTSTYLRTCNELAQLPEVIDLSTMGATPGREIRITSLGSFAYTADSEEVAAGALAVFSASATVHLQQDLQHRVPGALMPGSGIPPIVTPPTHFSNCDWPTSTDIPEDFLVETSVNVVVPTDARYLIISPWDEFFTDNVDADGDYQIVVELVDWPEAPVAGDLDDSGLVDGLDLGLLLMLWGPCANCAICFGDLNGDCMVDAADLGILLSNWGATSR